MSDFSTSFAAKFATAPTNLFQGTPDSALGEASQVCAVEKLFVFGGACGGSASSSTANPNTGGDGGDCGEYAGGTASAGLAGYGSGGGGAASPFGAGGDSNTPNTVSAPSQPAATAYGAGPGGSSNGPYPGNLGAAGISGAIEFEYWSWAPAYN